MKPTVIAANQAGNGGNTGNGSPAGAGINIPINRDYVAAGSPQQHQQHYAPHQQQQQQPHQFYNSQPAYGSPRQQQQQQHHQQVPPNQQQQHFQPTFGFEPDMDMDMDNMFPRSRLGRLHHDPFAGFGGTHFGFPQLSTMGRRARAAGNNHAAMEHDDDFFNRLPSEFRQYIPEGFGARRTAGTAGPLPQQQAYPQSSYQQDYGTPQQQYPQQQHPQPAAPQTQQVPQSPSKRLCDAAIQTEDPAGRSEVDCAPNVNLNQHGLRNTMDMGVKSSAEQEQGPRSHSAPPPEQQQLNQQYQQQQQQQQYQQQQRPTPPPQFGTQTSPPVQQGAQQQAPQFHKTYYAPQQQAHPQQKQQTPPPPQTPGGSYVRTIPIFVEGRSEPIINAHKEIPNQHAAPAPAGSQPQASAHAQAQAYAHVPPPPQQQQQQRPAPLNTQQQQGEQLPQADAGVGLPPQTPHTVDSIKKIQDIQRDVLELMSKVEQFKGTRQDKEYIYLDEMLTRNLLKLDTIDTNGKDSIRLARKEAIKCIQASVNVLDAKAEENARIASGAQPEPVAAETSETAPAAEEAKSTAEEPVTPQPVDATKIQEPIPLPPPPSAAEEATKPAAASTEPTPEAAEESSKIEATTTVTESSE